MTQDGDRVELNAEGLASLPTYRGRGGNIVGFTRSGLAKVLFDGRGSALELHPDFLRASTKPVEVGRRMRPARETAAIERRRLLRAAFDKIRHDPKQRQLVDRLAGALGGRVRITSGLLDIARHAVGKSREASDAGR